MKRPGDAQQLTLPLTHAQVLAGYLNDTYRACYGRDNYGLDMTDRTDPCVYAGGQGVVVATGCDDSLGRTVIVRYDNVYNHREKRAEDVVIRYCYLSAVRVAAGRPVVRGELIGLMGCTAVPERGVFLHMEADTDLEHPTATPSLITEGDFLHPGNRQELSTFCPLDLLHVSPRQSIEVLQPDWCDADVRELPGADFHVPGSSLQVFEKFESALRATEAHLEREKNGENA